MNIQQALHYARTGFANDNTALDAELLLCFCLAVKRSHLYAWPEQQLTASQQQHFFTLIQQRQQGQPIAYLTGYKEFWSLRLKVTADSLIPRPDTECIVEMALNNLPRTAQTVVDLGTGSGAIALALAAECPAWTVIATDIYLPTLQLAQRNARSLHLSQVQFVQSHWFDGLAQLKADAIISNPPYIAADDVHLSALQYEPQRALIAADHGLADLNHLIQHAKSHLNRGGFLLLEHGFDQSTAVQQHMRQQGYHDLATCYDLAGHARGSLGFG